MYVCVDIYVCTCTTERNIVIYDNKLLFKGKNKNIIKSRNITLIPFKATEFGLKTYE